MASYGTDPKLADYLGRLNALAGIKDIVLHLDKVTGQDKTLDVVVEIFNEVNKGGTTLSKGDLALAKICATWPPARDEMKKCLDGWNTAGYHFALDWLLRNVNAVVTGEALFNKLEDVDAPTFEQGLKDTKRAIDAQLNLISARLGLDHDRVLGGRYAFPILSRYLHQQGSQPLDVQTQGRLLFWYVQSFLWGRFSGSTETILNQDLNVMDGATDPLGALIGQLEKWRGDLTVRPADFGGHSISARFYPLLYLLTRIGNARDWGTGLPIKASLLGNGSSLQVHHVFPKALLYKAGYVQGEVNAIANFCFLTQTTNLQISDRKPEEYFVQIEQNHPGALASQWIPADPTLWKIENYPDFLQARRGLLAQAANTLLDGLRHGTPPALISVPPSLPTGPLPSAPTTGSTPPASPAITPVLDTKEIELYTLVEWVDSQTLPWPEAPFELPDPDPTATPVIADLAWPSGLQTGLSQPLALIREDAPAAHAFQSAGYRIFTDAPALQQYLTSLLSKEDSSECA